MKTFRLLIVSLLLATSASAQHHRGERRGGDYSPTVYLISVHEVDTIYNCGGCAAQQAAARNRMAVGNATQDYIDTHRPGFQQTEKPQFVFASKNNRFSFSMGGFVALRAGYDFDGIVDNIDFVPYDIPVPGNYNSKQKLMMDASTSRLFLKAITNTRALGRVVIYMDADFRGGAEGSYTPRLRSATYGENFKPIHQRVPDFPMYLQYAWGADRSSHLRASAVLRNPYMYKVSKDATTSLFGWGVQLSGTIKCCDWFRMFMNGVYGKGITPYIQDLTGSGLDFTPNPADPTLVRMMPMWGVQAAGQINFTPRLFVSGGYSTVRVQRSEGYYTADQYKQGQYIFGNIFYSLTPRCKVAAEYLYGSRKDMNSMKNHANRVNVMVQYNF